VQAAIQAAQAKRARRAELTADRVLADLQDVIAEARGAKQYSAAIKGLELLARHVGLVLDAKGEAVVRDELRRFLDTLEARLDHETYIRILSVCREDSEALKQ
jgi:hypothetical protein